MKPKPIRTKPTESDAETGTKGKRKKQEPTTFLGKLWHNWIKPIGLAVLVVFGFRSVFVDWNDVPSASMEPTILVGDRVAVNKLAYGLQVPFSTLFGGPWWITTWSEPHRGDIVVFFQEQDEPDGKVTKRFIKRIIGVPGDEIEVRDNVLFINGIKVENHKANVGKFSRLDLDPFRNDPTHANTTYALEPLGAVLHPLMYVAAQSRFANYGPKTVPEGHYLMMGDNRNASRDGRQIGLPAGFDGFGFVPRENIVGRAFGVAFSLDKKPSFRIRWDRLFSGFDQQHIEDALSPGGQSES